MRSTSKTFLQTLDRESTHISCDLQEVKQSGIQLITQLLGLGVARGSNTQTNESGLHITAICFHTFCKPNEKIITHVSEHVLPVYAMQF